MARPLRIEVAGAVYHVTARGNGREAIYRNPMDRVSFLDLLGKVCTRFHWTCHAYCLMGNHYHLVVQTKAANLSRGMRELNGIYTQAFNRHHHRVGHVFQGRYKAILVDKDSYLLELIRYVLLNPVRAKLVAHPGQWPDSSYRALIGRVPCPDWLTADSVLSQFAARQSAARRRFIQFVAEGKNQPRIWEKLRQQIYLGDERFITRMQRHLDDKPLAEIPKSQRLPPALSLNAYFRRHPNAHTAMIEAYASGHYTLKAIADHCGVHYSTVSRAVKRFTV